MATDEIEKIATPVNKPESGSYGEGAALDRLEGALPPMAEAGPPPQSGLNPQATPQVPLPPPSLGGGPAVPTPGNLPPGLLAPTQRPEEPITANIGADMPLAAPEPQMTAAQERLEVLIALAQSPRVSDETREWAQLWVQTLTETEG